MHLKNRENIAYVVRAATDLSISAWDVGDSFPAVSISVDTARRLIDAGAIGELEPGESPQDGLTRLATEDHAAARAETKAATPVEASTSEPTAESEPKPAAKAKSK